MYRIIKYSTDFNVYFILLLLFQSIETIIVFYIFVLYAEKVENVVTFQKCTSMKTVFNKPLLLLSNLKLNEKQK